MKKILSFAVVLALLGLTDPMPFGGTDVGKLHPVEVLYVGESENTISIITDTGVSGAGNTLEEAIADLHMRATGKVFLETANYLLLSPQMQLDAAAFWDFLRPACQVYYCRAAEDIHNAASYLESHPSQITLLSWRTGTVNIPYLEAAGEGFKLYAP